MNAVAIDKRRHRRVPVSVKYHLFIDDDEYQGFLDNISRCGAHLEIIHPKLPSSSVSKRGLLALNFNDGWTWSECIIVNIDNPNHRLYSSGAGIELCW